MLKLERSTLCALAIPHDYERGRKGEHLELASQLFGAPHLSMAFFQFQAELAKFKGLGHGQTNLGSPRSDQDFIRKKTAFGQDIGARNDASTTARNSRLRKGKRNVGAKRFIAILVLSALVGAVVGAIVAGGLRLLQARR